MQNYGINIEFAGKREFVTNLRLQIAGNFFLIEILVSVEHFGQTFDNLG
jgi:hypothetical protein